jgi:hypothetical protein
MQPSREQFGRHEKDLAAFQNRASAGRGGRDIRVGARSFRNSMPSLGGFVSSTSHGHLSSPFVEEEKRRTWSAMLTRYIVKGWSRSAKDMQGRAMSFWIKLFPGSV